MITTYYKKHKVARMLFISPDTRLEIVASKSPLNLTYKLTLVFNGTQEAWFFSDDIRELLPPGQYPFNVFTGWHVSAPYDVKTVEQGSVTLDDYRNGSYTKPLIVSITYQQ